MVLTSLPNKPSKMDMGVIMSRYDRLLVCFYIVCTLCFLSIGGGIYFIKKTSDKFTFFQTALDTATYEFDTCKKLYKKGLTLPRR